MFRRQLLASWLVVAGCSASVEVDAGAMGSGGGSVASGGGSSATGGGGGGDAGSTLDAGAPDCEPFGHFPAPVNTFTLPVPADGNLAPGDVQAAYPQVDWATLDRLYIPAGVYKTVRLENLPTRDASRPLIITNKGGQVQVGPNDNGNFIWAMNGGANWILTGRYDPEAQTGDAAFPGHRCGAYANSEGTYGFLSDDAFDLDAPYLHMGLAVGNATDFELEFLEVKRSGFAGVRLLNARAAGDPAHPMANVKVHDLYVHDTDSEGFYFGWTGSPPSNLFPNLQVFNNRIVRTGSETLQVQDLGEGSRIHHNTLVFSALHWLDNFGPYQDGNVQLLVREGTVEFDHNVVIGGAGTFLSFFNAPEPGDAESHVTFHDNFWADTRNLGGYLNGSSTPPSTFGFRDETFSALNFSYTEVNPAATDPGVVFGVNGAHHGAISFEACAWDGTRALVSGLPENGTKGVVTASGNVRGPVTALTFVDWGFPGSAASQLTQWGDVATLAPDLHPISYAVGAYVMFDGALYRAKTANSGKQPDVSPDDWEHLPQPADDVRALAPWTGVGVQ